jgi:hypothetical protein
MVDLSYNKRLYFRDEPTKTDVDVLNALEPISDQIDVNMYPYVKKWFNVMRKYKADQFR